MHIRYNCINDQLVSYINAMQESARELISEGTYGRVYKLVDPTTGTVYAVKERKFYEHDTDGGIPCDIIREIGMLKRLNHENIVRPVRVEIDSKARIYRVTLEYFDYNLMSLIRNMQALKYVLKMKDIKFIIKQILKSLEYLHTNMIIHRDIKPSNILVSKDMKVKLADFGFARSIGLPLRVLSKNIGTPIYKAPELLVNGEVIYGSAVDIWAVGCILINLLI